MYKIHLKKVKQNGKIYEYYTLNYKIGPGKYLPLTSSNKNDLLNKVERLEGKNVNYNVRLDAPTALKDLFNEYLDIYIKGSRSISTYISYKADINNHIIPYFNGLDYKDMTSIKIQEFYNHLITDKHLSVPTANKVYLILKETLEYGVSLGIFYRNPCDKTIKKKHKERRLSSPIKPEYLSKMWDLIGESKYSNLYKLMLYTSLRRGEALGIKIKDINLKDKTVYIHDQVITYYLNNVKHIVIEEHTKTHLSRIIALSDDAIRFISDELNKEHYKCISDPDYHNNDGLLFTDDAGKMLDPSNVSRTFKDMAKRIDCPSIRLHDLRHTAATIMYETTGNIYAVQKALGHEDPRTTENYVGPSIKLQKEGAKAVADALNKQLDILK